MAGDICGREIAKVREMTDDELAAEGWTHVRDHERPTVLVLDDGRTIYPSKDPEGNGPGALFGATDDQLVRIVAPGE